jgi:CubicO group peptidase (beta-lactamase class C family)
VCQDKQLHENLEGDIRLMLPIGIVTRQKSSLVNLIVVLGFLFIAPLLLLPANISKTGTYRRPGLDPKVEAAIEQFRPSVTQAMDKSNIPSLALALVDDQGILWTEGFGNTGNTKEPTTPDTLFPTCGLSRLIAATAVLLAVQDGLVKLDEPITTYLSNIWFNSRYEIHPEQKITLRRLPNCTAGIPDATPVGNILEPASTSSFEDHVKSLSGSWLVCPVDGGFYSSSASFDLAAYIVGVASGKSYKDYLQEKLFAPLGMSKTTADRQNVMVSSQLAIGNMLGMSKLPVLGAGQVYSSARDIGRLIQLHINRGIIDGRRILDQQLIGLISSPVGILDSKAKTYSGQGIIIDKRYPERTETLHWQNNWAFGFLSFLHWYPEYKISVVVLTNKMPNYVYSSFGMSLTDKLIKGKFIAKRFSRPDPDPGTAVISWQGWEKHQPSPYKNEWRKHCGTHNLKISEYSFKWWLHVAIWIIGQDQFTPRIQIREKDGFLCVTESKLISEIKRRSIDEKLQEIQPGVFITKYGDTLDLTAKTPAWCNYHLEPR